MELLAVVVFDFVNILVMKLLSAAQINSMEMLLKQKHFHALNFCAIQFVAILRFKIYSEYWILFLMNYFNQSKALFSIFLYFGLTHGIVWSGRIVLYTAFQSNRDALNWSEVFSSALSLSCVSSETHKWVHIVFSRLKLYFFFRLLSQVIVRVVSLCGMYAMCRDGFFFVFLCIVNVHEFMFDAWYSSQ